MGTPGPTGVWGCIATVANSASSGDRNRAEPVGCAVAKAVIVGHRRTGGLS
jgi:hypothetical protein